MHEDVMAQFRAESPAEYFKELVERALEHQRLDTAELTAYYVVNLLCGYVRLGTTTGDTAFPGGQDEPLAFQLQRAIEAGGAEQRIQLRRLGDASLFVSGFFSDSLKRTPVDIDYYVALGGYAYGSLSRLDEATFGPVFAELAEKFVAFVDVLSEVSERSALTCNSDLLRLYERWLRTGSRHSGQLLAERGIAPNASIGSRFLQ